MKPILTRDELFELLRQVNPETVRIPPGFVAFAARVEAALLEKLRGEPEAIMWYERGSGKPILAHKTDTVERKTYEMATKLYILPTEQD